MTGGGVSTGGNRLITPDEAAADPGLRAAVEAMRPAKRKRGGRKPGSKNKPKAKADPSLSLEVASLRDQLALAREQIEAMRGPTEVPHVDIQFSATDIDMANVKYAALLAAVTLEQIANMRVGAMDSESRLAALLRQQAALAQQALAALRAAL